MKLEVFEKGNRVRVSMIKTYDYVTYEDDIRGIGKFEIRIPTNEISKIFLTYSNWILFDNGILGIIKEINTVEDQDNQISIKGYLSNHILEFRSFLLTSNYYNYLPQIALSMFNELFVNPTDVRRQIPYLVASQNVPTWSSGKIRYQSTGKTFLETISEMFEPYDFGFELYPIIKNYNETTEQYANVDNFEFRMLKPNDRTWENTSGNTPVVFSFDLNNLQQLEYDEDGTQFASVAIVASEGVGQERKIIEVQNLVNGNEMTGYERIELYVDARDLQTEDEEGQQQLTDEELEEVMTQRGKEKLQEHQKFISFDASIIENKYKYGIDFYKGDFVSVVSKMDNKIFDVQIVGIKKTYSNGVEHLDIKLGTDKMRIREIKERRLYNV